MPCAVLIFLKIEDELNHYMKENISHCLTILFHHQRKKKDKMKEKGASFVTMYLKNSTLHFTRVAFPEKQKLQQM